MSATRANFGKALFEVKKMFFDRAAVVNSVNKATLKALGHIGGLIRLTARRSIKKGGKKNVSKPGSPPLSHTGLLKNGILYSYDKYANSIVVGPVLLNTKQNTAPHTLEYGGSATVRSGRGSQRVAIKPRPFMQPAYEKNKGAVASIWKDSIKK